MGEGPPHPDRCANAIYEFFGLDGARAGADEALVAMLEAGGRLQTVRRVVGGKEAMLEQTLWGWQIWVSRRLGGPARTFAALHELGEWWLGRVRYSGPEREATADRIAAALVAPRARFRPLCERFGFDPPRLSRHFGATQTCLALRYGEVTGRPVLVVDRAQAWARGDPFVWSPEGADLFALARGPLPPSVQRIRLTDRRGRLALSAVD
jgi:IrrE N-terminal-like domain